MPESEAKKAWMKKNTVVISVKFNRGTEQKYLDYLADKPAATVFKAALREYMENHPEQSKTPRQLGRANQGRPDRNQPIRAEL